MSRFGLYEGLKKNASPTCQFGVMSSSQILAEETWADNFVEKQLARIQSGDFVGELQDQDRVDEIRRQFFSTSIARSIRDAEQKSDAIFRNRSDFIDRKQRNCLRFSGEKKKFFACLDQNLRYKTLVLSF